MKSKIHSSIKYKLLALVVVSFLPILVLAVYMLVSMNNYADSYDKIVSNMTVANNYNMGFKEEMDESLYKLAVGAVTFDTIDQDDTLKNPYTLIAELQGEFNNLVGITTDSESRAWLQSLLRNLDTLKVRVDDLKGRISAGNNYDSNIAMLDNDIYILTELIQDDIQYYIYYQTESIESLRAELNTAIGLFGFSCTAALVIILSVAFVIAIYVVKSITKPIRNLVDVTEQIAEGDFNAHATSYTKDELETLAIAVNTMAGKLGVMVDQIKDDERKMRHAELRLLQEQINPHFLYNTLDTIVWLIEGNDPDKAVSMVVSLSEFFRQVLSKGQEYISIKDEESHIRNYLQIQQVRYRDILDFDIQIDPELYAYQILKLTLQPMVENSLYHGIKYKRAKGLIKVRGHLEGDMIHLTVEDDGVGMSPEELATLQKEITKPCQETEKGFGLANVNERIRMNFGPQYGMQIESVQGEGTTVHLHIPARLLGKKSKEDS